MKASGILLLSLCALACCALGFSLACAAGDVGDEGAPVEGGAEVGVAAEAESPEQARERIFATHDAIVAAMVEGRSTTAFETPEWQGVNLNGTPMSAAGFEGEQRAMEYDDIQVLDREVRVYGDAAALRWHANFHVKVNGQPSFAEMRLLDVYVRRDGEWLLDLTQVTPIFGTVGNPPEG